MFGQGSSQDAPDREPPRTFLRPSRLRTVSFASISFLRWAFYIPADPWLAIVMLVVDGLIIYGLASNEEWFSGLQQRDGSMPIGPPAPADPMSGRPHP